MLFLGKYEEFAPNMGFPSIREHLHKAPYSAKNDVLRYLKAGEVHMVTAAKIVDVITGEATKIPIVHMNDGKYSWNTKIIYYIEKHNLRLPKEIEEYILNKAS